MSEMYKWYINLVFFSNEYFRWVVPHDLRPIIQHNKVTCDLKKTPLEVVCISKEHKMMLNGSSTEEDASPFVPSWSHSRRFLFEFVFYSNVYSGMETLRSSWHYLYFEYDDREVYNIL